MYIISIFVLIVISSITTLLLRKYYKLSKLLIHPDSAEEFFMPKIIERDKRIEFLDTVVSEAGKQIAVLENAISSQLISRSNEVGSPPPSGAYHTLFVPTGRGKVLMVYICLDTGHVARWHFQSPEALEEEAKRFVRVAQELRNNTLPDTPQVLNIAIGNSGTIH